VNIGEDYEIGRYVCPSVCVCVSVGVFVYMYFEAPYLHNGAR